ncbi:MAG: hypothetical protein ACLQE9_04125 [Roseiarcus sp.]
MLEAPTLIGAFLERTRCLAERWSEALLDRHAALIIEAFADE